MTEWSLFLAKAQLAVTGFTAVCLYLFSLLRGAARA